jgi:hypothetical protein
MIFFPTPNSRARDASCCQRRPSAMEGAAHLHADSPYRRFRPATHGDSGSRHNVVALAKR